MIFGFNTNVEYANTVYHVQSEARQLELLLQTQVFVKGRCIGKRATSYADKTKQPDFSEERMHDMLKDQHKHFVSAVREGRIEAELAISPPAMIPPVMVIDTQPPPLDDVAARFAAAVASKPATAALSLTPLGGMIGKGLSLECLPPASAPDGSAILVSVQVHDPSGPASGAQISCRIAAGQGPATYVYATSDAAGVADVRVSLNSLDLNGAALLIQASHRGKSATRKYQLKTS